MTAWLLTIFENFPRINFAFHSVTKTFMFINDRDYVQSLVFWAAIPLILCLLLSVIVLIVWSFRCCRNRSDAEGVNERSRKRRNEVDRFACGFYVPIFMLCIAASVCLYANEWANRGMNSFVGSLDDLKHSSDSIFDGITRMNLTISNATRLNRALYDDIIQQAAERGINQTALKLLLMNLVDLNFTTGNITYGLSDIETKFNGFRTVFDSLPDWIARIELERWVLFAILYSTLFVIGIFGLIAVCKRSRKGTMAYGVGGIFVFVVGWALAGAALFISLMLSDACTDPKPFLESKLPSNSSKEMFRFYVDCIANAKARENPITSDTKIIEDAGKAVNDFCQGTAVLISGLFPQAVSEAMTRKLNDMRGLYASVINEIHGFVEIVDCRNVRREYETAATALCYNALPAFAMALLFTLVFCAILFGVLIAVSAAWRIFKKRLNDYVEVENQDPFSIHRGNSHHSGSVLLSHDQSNIPADFYGTHVFNPRTRFASAAYTDNEPETNGNVTATAPTWRNTPPPAYDSMHGQQRRQQSTASRTLA